MLILNESKIVAQPKERIDYSVEQFLYESAEAYFALYQEAVAMDVKVLQSKANGIVEESALESIEEANFGEMMEKAGKFIEDMFVNLFKLIGWFKDKLKDAKDLWNKSKDKAVARATGHTVSVHEKWEDADKQLKVICAMLDALEAKTKALLGDIEKGEGLTVDRTKLSATIADEFDDFTTPAEIIDVVLGKKVDVQVDQKSSETAILNISTLLNDKSDLEARVHKLKTQIESIIKGLDKSQESFEAKNAALFQVLSSFNKSANAIVSAYIKAHGILLAENKSFIGAREKAEAFDKTAEKANKQIEKVKGLKDTVVSSVAGAKDSLKDKKAEIERKASEK